MLSESCGENANNTKSEEYLEESSIIQDDYKKLKHENERYRQDLYVLRLKLEAGNAVERELQQVNEALEQSLAQCDMKTEKIISERDEKYRAERAEYENQIANLEANNVQNVQEINELREEVRKYKDLANERPPRLDSTEDNLIPYKQQIEELVDLLESERKKQELFEEKLASVEHQRRELEDILQIVKEQLAERNVVLESTREELAIVRVELESLKVTPSSDTCRGNSLFAEVEDRRQMLLDKMKGLQSKYNETKRALSTKTNEIKILRAEKAAMVRKWETDAIDTLQENADLLDKYKSRIFQLESKLKAEMKRNQNQSTKEPIPFTSNKDSFNYAQSLLVVKKKELEQLNEKFDKQSLEMLIREERNHDISKQLRYWRSKAMSMEAQMLAIKTQLETERTNYNNDDKCLLEAIENCTFISNADIEKKCDLKGALDVSDNNIR